MKQVMEPSFLSTYDQDPYAFYRQAIARQEGGEGGASDKGEVFWDEGLKAWLVTSYAACKDVLKRDDASFFMPERLGESRKVLEQAQGGPRQILLLSGDEHLRMHQLWLRLFSPRRAEEWRKRIIRPIANALIDRFIAKGRCELAADFTNLLPIRVIAAIAGLPSEDDAWLAECKKQNDAVNAFFAARLGLSQTGDPAEQQRVNDAAIAASNKLNDMIMPFVEARRDSTGDDLISVMWREGKEALADFGAIEARAAVRVMVQTGSDTATYAMTNAIHLLLQNPDMLKRVRDGGDEIASRFVEESIRLHGTVHFRSRQAIEDTTIAGCPVMKGEAVMPLIATANRDPSYYANPDAVDLERKTPRDHLGFHYGIRMCVGAALARAEILEAVQVLLERMPDMALDPAAEAPRMRGWLFRAFRPLNVTFTPGAQLAPAAKP